jgi:uncharacterized protein YaiI (UPF0178 family)
MHEKESCESVLNIYIDADACPVKDEIYRVARRYSLDIIVVANSWMRVPETDKITLKLVEESFDAADDWIAEAVEEGDIVITGDIPLASRCLKKGAAVIGNGGRPFTVDNIGELMASRELRAELRQTGEVTGGPPPFGKKNRSRFLQKLDETVHAIRRRQR